MASETLRPLYRNAGWWYASVSAYWFASSFKWFIALFLIPSMVRDIVPLGEQNTVWGAIVALGAAEAMVGPALMGWLSDRTRTKWGRRRPFVALGAALTAIACFMLGSANSVWALAFGYLMLQISDDVGTGPYSALIPELVPQEHRGRASGMLGLLQSAAQILGAATGLALGARPDMVFAVIAAVNVLCALVVVVVVREPLRPRAERSSKNGWSWRSLMGPFRSADFRWVWVTRFLVALGYYLIITYAVNYLGDVVKVFRLGPISVDTPFEAIIVIAVIISMAGIAGALIGGRLADRVGRKAVIVTAGGLMCASVVPFALIPMFGVIAAVSVGFGLGYGAYISANWALVCDVLPDAEGTGRDMGIWQASIATPQILSGAVGAMIDFGNDLRFGAGYSVAFLLASGLLLCGSTLVRRVRGST